MKDQSLDASMNIGSEIRLSEDCTKNIRIGSIKMIREVRQLMKNVNYKFSPSIGRDKWASADDNEGIDWPAIEESYRKAFNVVLVGGLSDDEYDSVDEDGIKELDTLLDRFL